MARLHMICGNCGSNDEFEYVHGIDYADVDEMDMEQIDSIAEFIKGLCNE